MSSYHTEVGIDVSKATLDAHAAGKDWQQPNTPTGIRSLLRRLRRIGGNLRVTCEATGCHPRAMVLALLEAGVPVSVVNPRMVRDHARSKGLLAKTDRLDARIIASFAQANDPPLAGASYREHEALAQLHRHLAALIKERAALKASLDHYSEKFVLRRRRRLIRLLDNEVEETREKLREAVLADPSRRRKHEALTSVVGVGEAVSMALIVGMPELGSLNRGQAAALAGLAPMNRDSGRARGRRTIQAGRAMPRRALYMAALTAAHRSPLFKGFYARLREAGKPAKVALIAVERKLLIHLNTLLKNTTQEECSQT